MPSLQAGAAALARAAGRVARRAFAPVDIASLACFRIAFGAVMAWEVVRYFQHGWISSYYIQPDFHFTYFGFGWVKPWPGRGMYVHFAVMGLAALGIMAGMWYRLCAAVFFLAFTHVFLIDQAYYLNHFYLISLIAFVLVFVPAHRAFSLDARRRPALRSDHVPSWTLCLLRAQVGIPYIYGGLAKINGDWLRGEPIGSWLADRTDFPLIGRFFTHEWAGLAFAYGGLILDLTIVPLLLWKRTRRWAFAAALVFHGLNAILFRIGIFPWMMIAATLLFFEPDWPRRVGLLPPLAPARREPDLMPESQRARLTVAAIAIYLTVQALVPLRHVAYPGNVSWTEEGHLFAWHMKLRDKDASARFVVKDADTGQTWSRGPRAYLTRRQAERMAGQPDMILQFAHHPQALVDPDTDLAAQARTLGPAPWIVPLRQPLRKAPRSAETMEE